MLSSSHGTRRAAAMTEEKDTNPRIQSAFSYRIHLARNVSLEWSCLQTQCSWSSAQPRSWIYPAALAHAVAAVNCTGVEGEPEAGREKRKELGKKMIKLSWHPLLPTWLALLFHCFNGVGTITVWLYHKSYIKNGCGCTTLTVTLFSSYIQSVNIFLRCQFCKSL